MAADSRRPTAEFVRLRVVPRVPNRPAAVDFHRPAEGVGRGLPCHVPCRCGGECPILGAACKTAPFGIGFELSATLRRTTIQPHGQTMATADRFDTKHPPARVSSEILDRLPPQNLDAELGVLGSLLHDPQMCDEVALSLHADDFYADANQKLYRQILALHEEGKRIDVMLLAERLQKAGELEAVGGKAYLAQVLQAVPYAANVMHYAEIVREKASLRALIHASTEILREAWDPSMEIREAVNRAEEKIFAVRDHRTTDQVTSITTY